MFQYQSFVNLLSDRLLTTKSSPTARKARHEVTEFKSQATGFANGYQITAFIVYNCAYNISALGPGKGRQETGAQAHHNVIPCHKKSQMLYGMSFFLYSYSFQLQ
jgi:hypothetical protein